ncbi:hypothetical protein Bsph_0407 [Lysinibacillus sphaericus C3-41]|uniref:Uncharacterized protein n=1 Tax=Lysinibacillus sphaericus (strain C3-41) TaxID=444177 RepID=B1HVL5_LYSSC|nr:hypothetical protein Bsph_0407 [Lysinibacillus sphaericus C3-41]
MGLPLSIAERVFCILSIVLVQKTFAESRKKCIIYSIIIDIRFQ